jgi:hypothetical protein
MKDRSQEIVEIKKEWIAPELKKIDIEEITADGFQPGNDAVVPAEADAS